MNKKNKNLKSKKIFSAVLAVFIMLSSLNLFYIAVSAADEGPVTISINIPGTVQGGDIFEVIVNVRNVTDRDISGVSVSTDNTSSGVISLTTSDNLTSNISKNSEVSYSFYFSVSSTSSSNIYDIYFEVSYTGFSKTETRRIRVTPAPEQPVISTRPFFEVITDVYPKTATIGTNMKISVRFANRGGSATNVKITIDPPDDNVEALSVAPKPAMIMGTGQTYSADFSYKITDNAKAGLNKFKVEITCNEGASLIYDIGVFFEKSSVETDKNIPVLNIISIDIPEKINQGENFDIKAIVENTGSVDAKNAEVKINYPTGIRPLSSETIIIDSLGQNEKKEVLFRAAVNDTADEEYHSINLSLNYDIPKDNETEKINKSYDTGLLVLPKDGGTDKTKNFSVSVQIPGTVKPNEDFKVSVTVKNNGAVEKNLYLTVEAPLGIERKSANEFLIPELKAGESIIKEIIFNANDIEGKYCRFDISLTGKDIDVKEIAGTTVSSTELPKIAIESIKLPQNVNIGETFDVDITVVNTGFADAENIILAIAMESGILNKTADTVKIDSIKPGRKETVKFTFYVDKRAGYGYTPFTLDVSYSGGERLHQYFGMTVNSSDLKIDYIRIPNSVNEDMDFNVEVAIKNTGADTTDITLSLSPAGGLINKSSNIAKIESIKSGETIVKTFTFMASGNMKSGYSLLTVILSHGEDTITQYSGTFVNVPEIDEEKPEDKTDIPVVIISWFNYLNTENDAPSSNNNNNNDNIDYNGGGDNYYDNNNNNNGDTGVDFNPAPLPIIPRDGGDVVYDDYYEDYNDDTDMFSNTSVYIVDAPIMAFPDSSSKSYTVPEYGYQDGINYGSSSPGNSASIDTNAVYGGKTFIFTVELLNTHKSVAVKDLKVTISQEHGIFNPKSGSNTFFVEWLGPGQTTEINIPLIVKSDAVPDSYGLTISMTYKSESGETALASEIINIPVQQEMRFSVGEIPPIYDIEMGDEAYVTVQFGNLGKSKIYNVKVSVQGEGFMNYDGAFYAGSIDAGSSFLSKEFTLTPFMPGFINGSFIFTYEDAEGNSFYEECPFSFMVTGGEDMWGEMPPIDWGDGTIIGEDGLPVMNPDGEEEESGVKLWLLGTMTLLKWVILIGAAVVTVAVVIIVIVILVKRSKKKKAENDEDDEY